MNDLTRGTKPPLTPPDCCDWITPDDAIRHALASFYAACRYYEHASRIWGPDDTLDREAWLDTFTEIFTLRVNLQAGKAGIPIHDETETWLKSYIEPCFHREDQAADMAVSACPENPISAPGQDIHCAQSHNETGEP